MEQKVLVLFKKYFLEFNPINFHTVFCSENLL